MYVGGHQGHDDLPQDAAELASHEGGELFNLCDVGVIPLYQ